MKNSKRMDFGQFIDGQSKLQSIGAIAHSSRSIAFANVMNFCDFRPFSNSAYYSYEIAFGNFLKDDENLAKVQNDGSLIFGRFERKFSLDKNETLLVGENENFSADQNRNSQQMKQRSEENSMERKIDEDWDFAQFWECGFSSQKSVLPWSRRKLVLPFGRPQACITLEPPQACARHSAAPSLCYPGAVAS